MALSHLPHISALLGWGLAGQARGWVDFDLFPSRHMEQHSAPKGTARGKGVALKSVGI